ncbi:MAG: asparagine--tRNA ligase, partial [Chloroflexi bacterium]|nr:asparagine--tRNA ligase [Chloroflexota bacterium]
MGDHVYIRDLPEHEGQEVTLKGWLYQKTDKGNLQFLRLRDGTGIAQVVFFKKAVGPETFATALALTQESSIVVSGRVRADQRAPGFPGGYELEGSNLQVVQMAEEYPITPKEHGVDFLMKQRHLWIRSVNQWAVLRVRAQVIRAIREWLDTHNFINMDAPILTPAACEGTSTLFETDYFGEPAYLSQSGQLYNEAAIMAFGKVYCFGPTFRAEKSKTRRHIMEFWMVEPEMAYVDLDGCMEVEEQFVAHIVARVLEHCPQELQALERDTTALQRVTPPFPRISYDEAVEVLNRKGVAIPWGEDFGAPHETALAEEFDRPVFVHHYPTQCKAFYMESEPGRPEICKSVDLLAPEG